MAQIKKIGFTATRVSTGLGYNSSLLWNARERGYFGEDVAERLDRVYGIKRKTYEIQAPSEEQKPVEEPKAEEPKSGIDYVRLYNTIYQAVLTALQQNAKSLHDHLFEVR